MASSNFSGLKGKRAEREMVKILQPVVAKAWATMGGMPATCPVLSRNLVQSRKGGYDLVGLDWLALEVKHQETLKVRDWWLQALRQTRTHQTPVLMYKQNNVKWRAVVWGYVPAGDTRVRCPVDIDLDSFLLWFEHQTMAELKKAGVQVPPVPNAQELPA